MKKFKRLVANSSLIFFFLFLGNTSFAEVLVMVHGFSSSGATWYKHGTIPTLRNHGWQDGGSLVSHPVLGVFHRGPEKLLPYRTITVDLPAEAPLELQAQVLQLYFDYMQQQEPEQTYTIVAHSVGGVAARMMLVNNPNPRVNRLITIASPHLGSGMAEVAEFVAKTPLSIFGSAVDLDDIDDAKILLNQLQRESPNTFLYWLNRQPHPDLEYISIVRTKGTFTNKDFYVRSYSQDMNNIPAIKHAIFVPSYGEHELQYGDGFLIAQIVNSPPDTTNRE